MTEKERLLDQFEREIQGQPWHGSSLTTILDGVTAAQAAHRPSRDAHSIWEILLHMTGWKREVTRRALGHEAAEPAGGDWPAVGEPSDARWRETQADHLRAQRELIDAVVSLSDSKLATKVPGNSEAFVGAGLSVLATLWGLVQHDVYHAGQIAILKKMAAGIR
jgi:uncharacterized damage-inducible protein DinB